MIDEKRGLWEPLILNSDVCPCLRLTAENKFDVPDGTSLGFKPPAFNSFWLNLRYYIHLSRFEFTVQAALGFLYLSTIRSIIYTVSKRISQVNVVYHCGSSDQMALPSGHPQAFREKGLT